MRFIKYLFLIFMVAALSACSRGVHSDDYIKQSAAAPPMMVPAGAIPPDQKPYYRVPSVSVQAGSKAVSLVPPGSKMLRYRKHSAQSEHYLLLKTPVAAHMEKGKERLALSVNAKRAWSVVGRALRKTPYRILEKDKGMKTYYVLDSYTTHNKITQSTPIYRLVIKPIDQSSELRVLNQKNQPADAQIASRILVAIQKQLT